MITAQPKTRNITLIYLRNYKLQYYITIIKEVQFESKGNTFIKADSYLATEIGDA